LTVAEQERDLLEREIAPPEQLDRPVAPDLVKLGRERRAGFLEGTLERARAHAERSRDPFLIHLAPVEPLADARAHARVDRRSADRRRIAARRGAARPGAAFRSVARREELLCVAQEVVTDQRIR